MITVSVKSNMVGVANTIAATFLRSCAALALSREDGPGHLLHALAKYSEYNEDQLFLLRFQRIKLQVLEKF